MAAKCTKEQEALKKADQAWNRAEIDFFDAVAQRNNAEAEAQSWLATAISGCMVWIDFEQRLDEKCVIDHWIKAMEMLEVAENFWILSRQLSQDVDDAYDEFKRLRAAYHACLDREGEPHLP